MCTSICLKHQAHIQYNEQLKIKARFVTNNQKKSHRMP